MRIATGMSLTGTGTGYMTPEPKETGHLCNLINQVVVICSQDSGLHGSFDESELCSDRTQPSLCVEDKSYSASFNLLANEWLAFWLFLVASSYFLLCRNVDFFRNCRIKPAENVSLPDRTIPNARTENAATAVNSTFSCSESSGSCHKYDAYSEISDMDRASYWDSLLSLEEEDTEWLSDSKPRGCSFENSSTPRSYKCDSLSEISDIGSPGYWDSLLRLEEKDNEWIAGSKQELDYVWDGSPSPSYKGSWGVEFLPSVSIVSLGLDRASYWDSLLNLEEEDTEWLSDSKHSGCSFKNPSTPLSYKCDSLSEISDIGSPSYWDSLLRLEEKHTEWMSDSKRELDNSRDGSPSPSYKGSWGVEVLPSVSTVSSLTTRVHCNRSEDNISVEHLSETADTEEFSADEPLFWPFEGELNWDSEESWSSFCSSPRKRLEFDSRSSTSRIRESKQEGDDAVCTVKSETSRLSMWSKSSAKIVPIECEDEKVVLELGEALSIKLLSLSKTFLEENFASNTNDLHLGWEHFALDQELPIETLMGLKEFDGHEGLDSVSHGDVFMLD